MGARRTGGGGNAPGAAPQAPGPRQVWVLRDGQPLAVSVNTGLTDGRVTEVTSDQLQPGMPVIIDQRSGASQ
jgi:HlyD family secretion protein